MRPSLSCLKKIYYTPSGGSQKKKKREGRGTIPFTPRTQTKCAKVGSYNNTCKSRKRKIVASPTRRPGAKVFGHPNHLVIAAWRKAKKAKKYGIDYFLGFLLLYNISLRHHVAPRSLARQEKKEEKLKKKKILTSFHFHILSLSPFRI